MADQTYYLTPGDGEDPDEKTYYLSKPEDDEDKMTYYLSKADDDMDISLDPCIHESPYYGSPYLVYLPPGEYEITPTGGAIDDTGDDDWTWHAGTDAGDIGGAFSMEAGRFGGWASSAEEAFASVAGKVLTFYWGGGFFSLWIPSNDAECNNSGSLELHIKRIK
jgi:hypothetical protein